MGRARGTQGRGGRLTGVGYVISRKEVINVYRVSTTAYELSSTGKCFKFTLEIIVTPTAKRLLAADAAARCQAITRRYSGFTACLYWQRKIIMHILNIRRKVTGPNTGVKIELELILA